jgi:NitT/TauT family transport system substrate-binding protein
MSEGAIVQETAALGRKASLHRRSLLAGAGAWVAGSGLGALGATPLRAAEAVTYLFPAPPVLPAFGPIQLAKGKGYFAEAGLEVGFAVGRGGVDVAKQVGAGNALIGGIVADGPIMVRQNGVPIKIVAVFGGKGFMQLVVREDSGIAKPAWIPPIEAAGVKVTVIQSDEFFPHMAQGIGVSDQAIKQKPEVIRAIVKAALRGMKDIMDDPNKAAIDYVNFVPDWRGKEGAVKAVFNYYVKFVYPGQKVLGEVDAERLEKLQEFYLTKGLIQRKSPIEDLYTNAFIK